MPRQYSRNDVFRTAAFVTVFVFSLFGFACNQQPSKSAAAAPEPSVAKQTVPVTNMVLIRAGSFTRGRNRVTLTQDFWLGKYEVTQGEFAALMGSNPSSFEGDTNRPVEKVKFPDAVAYCAALTRRETEAGRLQAGRVYRLPTEAEWEYACLAGGTNLYSFGDVAKADEFAWTLENSESATHPVGQKKPNPWGLYDMHGNVWEWCNDWFGPFSANDIVDPVGPPSSKFKVFKGGSWNHNIEFSRASSRFMMETNGATTFVGFRIALGTPIAAPGSGTTPAASAKP